MAPLKRRRKKALAAAPPPPVTDRISNLPKDIQAQILSFLPAQEAVRTCVLGRTWRDVWKSTRRLLITGDSVQEVREFVDRLLTNFASLDASEIRFDPFDWFDFDKMDIGHYGEVKLDDDDQECLDRWIDRVLELQIKMLRIDISAHASLECCLPMSNDLLVSRHLTRLELKGVWFHCRCINLDGCPALEHLEITECMLLGVRKIMSLSLKRLVITSCDSHDDEKRIQICVPRLVSLRVDNTDSPRGESVRTPVLERMPELVRAEIWIESSMDKCECDNPVACYHVTRNGDTTDVDDDTSNVDDDTSDVDDDEEGSGHSAGQNTTQCVVLEGLAQARDLVLIDGGGPTYILRRDLRWCPTFSNLKTLLLVEEYMREPADCSALECMLEHAPLLEKLTVLILKMVKRDGKYKVVIKGYPDAKVTSTKISRNLQILKIICEAVDGIFVNVLNMLDTLNICFETRVTKYKP